MDEYSIRQFGSLDEASFYFKILKKKKVFWALIGPHGSVLRNKVRNKRFWASFQEHYIRFMRRRNPIDKPKHAKVLYSVAKKRSRHQNESRCSPPISTPSSIHEVSSSHGSRVLAMTIVDAASGKSTSPVSSQIVKTKYSLSDKHHHPTYNPLFDAEDIKLKHVEKKG